MKGPILSNQFDMYLCKIIVKSYLFINKKGFSPQSFWLYILVADNNMLIGLFLVCFITTGYLFISTALVWYRTGDLDKFFHLRFQHHF